MRIHFALFTAAIGVATLLSGSAVEANEQAEKKAVETAEAWLALVDAGEIGKSWETAAALFKGAVTREQWEQTVPAVRGPLGKVESRQLAGASFETSLPGAPDGEYVVIQFDTVFENKASAVETVTPMRDPDGEWRVSGYFIK